MNSIADATVVEEWRDVEGFVGIYSVSSLGRIRQDVDRNRYRAGWIRCGDVNHDGYLRLSLTDGSGRRKKFLAHVIVAGAFIGDAAGREVNHKNGIKTDNRPENLEYVSHLENMQHAIDNGLWSPVTGRGESSTVAKLSDAAVISIRQRYGSGEPQRMIAASYGVSRSLVGAVIRREVWSHV